jgi:hypothetical protein
MVKKYQLKKQTENMLKQYPEFLNNPIVKEIGKYLNETKFLPNQ